MGFTLLMLGLEGKEGLELGIGSGIRGKFLSCVDLVTCHIEPSPAGTGERVFHANGINTIEETEET